MRFVNGEQGNARTHEQVHAAVRQQAFRRHVEQVQLPFQKLTFDLAGFLPLLR